MMAQEEQRVSTAPEVSLTLEEGNSRLEKLVGELLVTNQELRFQVEQLETAKSSAERALARAAAGAAMLLP